MFYTNGTTAENSVGAGFANDRFRCEHPSDPLPQFSPVPTKRFKTDLFFSRKA